MGLRLPFVLFAFLLPFFWYAVGLVTAFKKKGFDPSLITVVSPLYLNEKLGLRLALGINLIACLLIPLTWQPLLFVSLTTLILAIIQLTLLAVFNRLATQPSLNYCLLVSLGVLALAKPSFIFSLVFLGLIATIQEYLLNRYLRSREKLYNNWVEKQVHKINRRHGSVRQTLSDEEWFYTLHIAVTENIARPKISRLGESVYFYLKRPPRISSGIMQVMADHLLSDEESIKRGSQIIGNILNSRPENIHEPIEQLKWLAKEYNGSAGNYSRLLLLTYPGMLSAWRKIS